MRAEAVRAGRLELVPLGVEHAGEMAGVLSDPALHRFTGGAPLDEAGLRARYERLVAGSPDPEVSWCNWVLRVREGRRPLVGTVQATVTGAGAVAAIAWVVGTPWQGRGFASQAARGLVGLLERRGVGVVVAHIHPEHRASAGVARAAGLTPTGEVADGEVVWRRTLGP
ncbi:GNAT family N-acetyltransferase [Streptomyces sp. NPDC018610]|uniref:GNAT family N-acetyltransferase n=1 Tax=Streptomyces sp. NPDC018610 TaxID=3365049 RepID=UPI0037AD929D